MWLKESTGEMISTSAWALDFWRAFLERPKIVRWMVRILVGKYAWSELIGMKMSVQKWYSDDRKFKCNAFDRGVGYRLEDMNYHKDNWEYKDW